MEPTKQRRTVVNVTEFSPDLRDRQPPDDHTVARILCERCHGYHFLQWGRMQEIMLHENPSSLQEILDAWRWNNPRERKLARTHAETLAEHLKAMHPGIVVRRVSANACNEYLLDLQTPIDTYRDSASEREWVDLVRRDIDAAANFRCPFCNATHEWKPAPTPQGICGSCGARYGRGMEFLYAFADELPVSEATAVLEHFDGCFHYDPACRVQWVRRPAAGPCATSLATVSGPDVTPSDGELPDLQSTVTTEKARTVMPTCKFCVHMAHLPLIESRANRDYYGGRYFFGDRSAAHCVYPLPGESAEKCVTTILGEECTNAPAYSVETFAYHLWWRLALRVSNAFPILRVEAPGLSAQAVDRPGESTAPVCRRFRLAPLPYGYKVPSHTISVHFGLEHENSIRRRARKNGVSLWRTAGPQIIAAIKAATHDPANAAIFKADLCVLDVHSPVHNAATMRFVKLIEKIVDPALLREGIVCRRLRESLGTELGVSRPAAVAIDALLAKRALAKSHA